MMAVLKEDDPRLVQLQENASSLSQLSTQTVFSMLDHLTQWGRHRLQSLSTAKTSGRHAREQTQTPGQILARRFTALKSDYYSLLY